MDDPISRSIAEREFYREYDLVTGRNDGAQAQLANIIVPIAIVVVKFICTWFYQVK